MTRNEAQWYYTTDSFKHSIQHVILFVGFFCFLFSESWVGIATAVLCVALSLLICYDRQTEYLNARDRADAEMEAEKKRKEVSSANGEGSGEPSTDQPVAAV